MVSPLRNAARWHLCHFGKHSASLNPPTGQSHEAIRRTWTKAQVLAYRAGVDRLDDAKRAAHDEKWSQDNKGQHYLWYPALPYDAAYPDMLHMNLNQFNSGTEEAFHSHLLDDAYDKPALKALAAMCRDKVNTRLKAHAEKGGAGVLLSFGLPGKFHVANGPKMKAVLRHPKLLMELCELMRPLWAAAEAASEPAVAVRPQSKEDLEKEAADATAAALTAAAGVPTGGVGGKAPRAAQ
eukprot:3576805-Prymnesium_polylepis.1